MMNMRDWFKARFAKKKQERYRDPVQLESMKQQWEAQISQQLSREDPLIDEYSGVAESMESLLHRTTEDDILLQQLEDVDRLVRTEKNRPDEIDRIQRQLQQVRRQKEELAELLEFEELNRR